MHHGCMRVAIHGVNLPGRVFCCPDGSEMGNVHVGVQVRREPDQLVRADEAEALWELDVDVVSKDGVRDFRGPAVQGTRGDRFIYLTWGDMSHGRFEMFRRAKLMLDRVDPTVMEKATAAVVTSDTWRPLASTRPPRVVPTPSPVAMAAPAAPDVDRTRHRQWSARPAADATIAECAVISSSSVMPSRHGMTHRSPTMTGRLLPGARRRWGVWLTTWLEPSIARTSCCARPRGARWTRWMAFASSCPSEHALSCPTISTWRTPTPCWRDFTGSTTTTARDGRRPQPRA